MKTHAELANLLIPATAEPMDDKWRAAWQLLDEDATTPEEHRCHARCWLTYRAIEGHVSHDEYMARVALKPCNLPHDHDRYLRWTTSLAAADFYYWIIRQNDIGAAFVNSLAISMMPVEILKKYPPALLSWLRVKCVVIYADYLDGVGDTKQSIKAAIEIWQQVMASLDWQKYPLRFLDGRGDMEVLHALMCISTKIGGTLAFPVNDVRTIGDMKTPWVQCLKKLSQKEGAIWA